MTKADPSHSPLVLLVEDDPLQQMEAEDSLRENGFSVLTAGSGEQALSELDKDTRRFTALVTDIRLGTGPNGWDVGRRAREICPGLPVVYMTGDSADEWASQGVPKSQLLQKPYLTIQLITAVVTLMNQSDSELANGHES
ncbi:response regulator [Rhizobium paknamense]|uniref:CheY-like chemotaxis protein n=1 Tax=Rhizobium paknamense TaxID=1206817 RepID=A0ABU0IDZ6_9HYPH|nr:response regulator [Rhizobium paknamense]MDQ0455873.1 CheY-like chemotaxis protein [Rhizobium paknamense]